MITLLSKKMASFFVCKNIIEKENEEVYEYGMELLLSTFFNTFIALILAILTHTLLPCLFFLTTFVIMRKTSGGFHAKTHLGCCCILVVIVSLFILFIKLATPQCYLIVSLICLIVSVETNILFAPLENENKPLSDNDKIRLKRCSIQYCLIILAIVLVLLALNFFSCMVSISLGMMTSAGSILAAKLQEKLK